MSVNACVQQLSGFSASFVVEVNVTTSESANEIARLVVRLTRSEVSVRNGPIVSANIQTIHRERPGKTMLFDPCLRGRNGREHASRKGRSRV